MMNYQAMYSPNSKCHSNISQISFKSCGKVIEEEKEGDNENEKDKKMLSDIPEKEEAKIQWERVDIELKGASIKKENIVKIKI